MPWICPEILQLLYERNLIQVFPNLTTILKLYKTLPIKSCKAERNFSNLSTIKKKTNNARGESELSFCSVYRKWYFKIVVIWGGDQRVRSQNMYEIKVLQKCDKQLLNKKSMLFLYILLCLWYLPAFFQFVICWDVSSHSQWIFTLVPNFVFALLYSCSLMRAQKIA
jgi:hypothetical protein